ncbi:MAG: CPBP family intramembrane metalloprotease [Chloroflexi bacterium]|nr:CPBP family intramembrane metalloprotease [Chloroflexota bacterium]
MEQDQAPVKGETQRESIPWSAAEGWTSVLLLILLNVGLLLVINQSTGAQLAQSALIVLAELAYLLPVVIILAWKRIPWRYLGFGKFDWSTMGIGCGLLIGGYGIILVHNLVATALGIDIQGDKIVEIFSAIDSPVWLVIALVVVAPLVEEIFFRGFLFQGFRKKYGWVNAMLLSSAIFGVAHLDPVSIIPTFVLGIVLSYVYHRSNSVWPGVILHFLINASSTCSVYVLTQFPNLIPS